MSGPPGPGHGKRLRLEIGSRDDNADREVTIARGYLAALLTVGVTMLFAGLVTAVVFDSNIGRSYAAIALLMVPFEIIITIPILGAAVWLHGRTTRPLAYMALGSLTGAGVPCALLRSAIPSQLSLIALLTVSGGLAGSVYWFIAVRRPR